MQYLLDTHTLIWWWDERGKLSDLALNAIIDSANEIYVSAATAWELAIKVRRGQLEQMRKKVDDYNGGVHADGFYHLGIGWKHALSAGLFTAKHQDPFDRVLAAQALLENMVLITRDPEMVQFGCKTLW